VNKIIVEGTLDMDESTPKLKLDHLDLWNILSEYYLDGSSVKITIEEINF